MVDTWTVEGAIPVALRASLKERKVSASSYVLIFLQIISELKTQRRTGWLDFNISDCESISDHMYRMGVISTLLPSTVTNILSSGQEIVTLDKARCVQIAIVHDMAEALVGDITPRDPVPKLEKHRRELLTMVYLTETLIRPYNEQAATEIMELWLDYEELRTIEARYVKDIDKFEMILQAFEYEKKTAKKVNLDPFFDSFSQIKTQEIRALAQEVLDQRTGYWS